MVTFTADVAADADNWEVSDVENGNKANVDGGYIRLGGVGTSPLSNYGHGIRVDNVTISGGDTIDDAYTTWEKEATQWSTQTDRWCCIAEDDTATFSTGSRPGSRSITTNIASESHNVNHVDGTEYNFPTTGALQTTLGAAVQEIIDRGGWASGNAIGMVNNSDQDASANENFSRKNWKSYENTDTDSEPSMTINYTAGAGGDPEAGLIGGKLTNGGLLLKGLLVRT